MDRQTIITKIIDYTKEYEKEKAYYKDAIKESYYKDYSMTNLRYLLLKYEGFI